MKNRLTLLLAILLLLVAILLPVSETQAATKEASGTCNLTNSGRDVTFSGATLSTKTEDIISVTVTLQELRDGAWYYISSASKTEYNSDIASATKSCTVSGGHYYRAVATHYVQTGNTVSTTSTSTPSTWIS